MLQLRLKPCRSYDDLLDFAGVKVLKLHAQEAL